MSQGLLLSQALWCSVPTREESDTIFTVFFYDSAGDGTPTFQPQGGRSNHKASELVLQKNTLQSSLAHHVILRVILCDFVVFYSLNVLSQQTESLNSSLLFTLAAVSGPTCFSFRVLCWLGEDSCQHKVQWQVHGWLSDQHLPQSTNHPFEDASPELRHSYWETREWGGDPWWMPYAPRGGKRIKSSIEKLLS